MPRLFVWDLTREYAGERISREVLTNRREIPGGEGGIIRNITITDGLGETDDTISVTLHGEWDYDGVLGVEHAGIWFGPFDIEGHSVAGESPDTTITGRIDREFQDTFVRDFRTAITSGDPAEPPTQVKVYIRDYEPFKTWGSDPGFVDLVAAAVSGSTSLQDVRGALEKYGFTVVPFSHILIGADWLLNRRVLIRSAYPVGFGLGDSMVVQSVPYQRVSIDGDAWSFQNLQASGTMELKGPVIAAPQYATPDVYNKLGKFENRRIAIGLRSLHVDEVLSWLGLERPTVYIDSQQSLSAFAVIAIGSERWSLQNNAVTASISVPFQLVLPGQVVTTPEGALRYPQWRVVKVTHVFAGNDLPLTTLDLAAFQGLWGATALNAPPAPVDFGRFRMEHSYRVTWTQPMSDVFVNRWELVFTEVGDGLMAIPNPEQFTVMSDAPSYTIPERTGGGALVASSPTLKPNTTYAVEIRALNLQGDKSAALRGRIPTRIYPVPTAVQNLTASPVGTPPRLWRLDWDEPASNADVVDYYVANIMPAAGFVDAALSYMNVQLREAGGYTVVKNMDAMDRRPQQLLPNTSYVLTIAPHTSDGLLGPVASVTIDTGDPITPPEPVFEAGAPALTYDTNGVLTDVTIRWADVLPMWRTLGGYYFVFESSTDTSVRFGVNGEERGVNPDPLVHEFSIEVVADHDDASGFFYLLHNHSYDFKLRTVDQDVEVQSAQATLTFTTTSPGP